MEVSSCNSNVAHPVPRFWILHSHLTRPIPIPHTLSILQESNLRIREIFSILTQGVEMTQYETSPENRVTKKIVWMVRNISTPAPLHMHPLSLSNFLTPHTTRTITHTNSQDSDIYRICVDNVRPSMAERAQGKIPPGLYLRDISEVREGAHSYQFSENTNPPENNSCCLSIVGSERTISLELPSKVRYENMRTCWVLGVGCFFCTDTLSPHATCHTLMP
jgi:hypothetical protein